MIPRCDMEDAVLRAAHLDAWDEDLRRHAGSCPVCADVVVAARFMASGASAVADHPLPDPGRIFWRAQLLAKREAAARAAKPIAFVEGAAFACALVASAFVLAWGFPVVAGWFGTLASAVTAAPGAAASQSGLGYGLVLGFCTFPVLLTLAVLNAARASRQG